MCVCVGSKCFDVTLKGLIGMYLKTKVLLYLLETYYSGIFGSIKCFVKSQILFVCIK